MEEGAKLHLKEWLVAQIESDSYDGLCWEDEDKTMFRIPWKHAAKKDYKQTEDAALFKAWAVYKGKYQEGRDKADPTMWKTRLRCALNKSTDFEEIPERNQLDITEPYKVYRIQQDSSSTKPAVTNYQMMHQVKQSPRSPGYQDKQKELFQSDKEEKTCSEVLMREHVYCEVMEKKNQIQAPAPVKFLSPTLVISDFRMEVRLLYQGHMVTKVVTSSPDGCFILQGRVPLGNERIYGPCSVQQISFPSPASVSLPSFMAEAMNRLLCHLERGVLLWVAPDGVFIKRFCQGRVYWSGPMAQHIDQPNKLEREKTFKLLDIPTFLNALQNNLQGKGQMPSYQIELCFGEEYPDPIVPKTRKLIMAQVVPLFAVELMRRLNLGQSQEKRLNLSSNSAGKMTLEG
ncbi:interferon regulatory factor 10 isoform X1 [Nothobranchius furzeri]|uniref:Bone morphogenetic protein 7b n=3 Tax=Nothobranchius TaxID=28779 RepID=A0A1A8B2Q0_NOTFU|nr:interferon regulatory factor 10 isoform X1 [Nothobranchius furzeri]KAF7210176.1 transcript variant X1 [Nothobranchius furzeri]